MVGAVGAIHVARFAWLARHTLGDVPATWTLAYVAAALAALLPAFGLVAHAPLKRPWWLAAFGIDLIVTAALLA